MKKIAILIVINGMIISADPIRVGLCITATNKYVNFAKELVISARKHFLKNCDVSYYIFTNNLLEIHEEKDVKLFQVSHRSWPYSTLMRFNFYKQYFNQMAGNDYLFAIDADMLFVADINEGILGNYVGVKHPGFWDKNINQFTYEFNHLSTACINKKKAKFYFAGGFYGGSKEGFFNIINTCDNNIAIDLSKNFIAIWHDESHLNKFFNENSPDVILSPSYCFDERLNLPFEKKIIAIVKNHADYR